MASLLNQQINQTYVALLKTTDNVVLSSTEQVITDGSGNASTIRLSTSGVGIGGSVSSGVALAVTGSVTISSNLTVAGTLTTVNTTDLDVKDPLIKLAKDNLANISNIGFYGQYSTNGSTALYAGLYRDFSDGVFKLFKDSSTEPTSTGNISTGLGYALADLRLGNLVFPDNAQLKLGDNTDLKISHNGTDSSITNETGHLKIENNANDKDIIFSNDDGAGGLTEYFRLDGSSGYSIASKNIRFLDNVKAQFGTSNDFQIYHSASNSILNQRGTGDLILENTTDDKDIKFKCDNGSGGTTEYYRLDGSTAMNIFSRNVGVTGTVQATSGFTFATTTTSSPDFAMSVTSNVMTISDVTGSGKLILDVDNVGINTTSPTEALHVVGNVLANAFNTISDVRQKKDFKDFSGLNLLEGIQVYNFAWKSSEKRSYGVKAHELQQVLPHAVSGEKDGEKMQQVDYTKIVPILLKSIKELKEEIDYLKDKINE
jgi:hypothetical protein